MKALQKVLLAAPPGIRLYTVGDADLTVYDAVVADREQIEIHDGRANDAGIVLGRVSSGCRIDGVSG